MNKLSRCLGILIAVLSILGCTANYKVNASETSMRHIIIFSNEISDSQSKELIIKKHGVSKIKDLKIINGIIANITEKQKEQLESEMDIVRIEKDLYVQALGKSSGSGSTTPTQPAQVIPWNVTTLKTSLGYSGNEGLGIKIAVIDSGIDLTHPDLKDNIKGGYNAINPKVSANDDYGHGTHVAGIIAAANNSIGVVGISSKASLYAVKVLDSMGGGYLSDLIEGIEWSVTNGMQIINMSLGVQDSLSLHDAIIKANQAGVVLVASAGNNPYGSIEYPAAYPEVISVAATDSNNEICALCPKGKIDISAPGVDIYSTYKGGTYRTLTGTSMAAPHISGTIAMMLLSNNKPDLNGDGKCTTEEVKKKLQSTAIDLGTPGMDDTFGAGLINAFRAVTE